MADWESLDLSGNCEPEHMEADFVSPSIFRVGGLSTILGHAFTDREDIPNALLLAVRSEHCWKTRFHSGAEIIDKNLTLSDHSFFQVIGVVAAQVSDWGPPSADVDGPANTVSTNRANSVTKMIPGQSSTPPGLVSVCLRRIRSSKLVTGVLRRVDLSMTNS